MCWNSTRGIRQPFFRQNDGVGPVRRSPRRASLGNGLGKYSSGRNSDRFGRQRRDRKASPGTLAACLLAERALLGQGNGRPATRVWHNALPWPTELPVPLIATEPEPDDRLASGGPFT